MTVVGDTRGEELEVALLLVLVVVVRGATTEVTDMTPLVLVAMAVQAQDWISSPSV